MDRARDFKRQLIVLFMREFSWGWEYTKKIVGETPIEELNELAQDLNFQRSLDAYERRLNAAAIMATIINMTYRGKGAKRASAKDMAGAPPRRSGEKAQKTLREAADDIGIRIPEGGIT